MLQYGPTLKEGKEVNHTRPHTVSFWVYEMSRGK